jgi:phospholipase/carboxylesterase
MYKNLNGPDYYPQSGAKPKQIIIMLHGVGADGENLMGLAPYFSDIYKESYIIAPNGRENYDAGVGVNGSYGYQWFSLWDRSYDKLKSGIKDASEVVADFIEEVREKFQLEYKDIILIGFSQGCMTAIHTALRLGKEIKAVIGFSGGTIITDQNELDDVITAKPPICLIHGKQDDVVPVERTEITEEALKRNNIKVESKIIDGLLHSIDFEGIKFAQQFLQNIEG